MLFFPNTVRPTHDIERQLVRPQVGYKTTGQVRLLIDNVLAITIIGNVTRLVCHVT